MKSPYTERIQQLLTAGGYTEDPRHIEAYMRLEHPTLDGLSRSHFANEVRFARECILAAGHASAESLARSYGL